MYPFSPSSSSHKMEMLTKWWSILIKHFYLNKHENIFDCHLSLMIQKWVHHSPLVLLFSYSPCFLVSLLTFCLHVSGVVLLCAHSPCELQVNMIALRLRKSSSWHQFIDLIMIKSHSASYPCDFLFLFSRSFLRGDSFQPAEISLCNPRKSAIPPVFSCSSQKKLSACLN